MPRDINEQEVERRMDDLRAEFGDAPVEEQTWERPPETFAELVDSAEEGYVGGAYAWVVRHPEDAASLTESMPAEAGTDRKCALLILGRGSDKWGLPGGGLEDGETHAEAVVREVREETSIECEPTDLFLLRRVTAVADEQAASRGPSSDARVHLLYAFFDATYEGGSIAVQPGELDGAAWFAEPPARLLPANQRRAETWSPEVADSVATGDDSPETDVPPEVDSPP